MIRQSLAGQRDRTLRIGKELSDLDEPRGVLRNDLPLAPGERTYVYAGISGIEHNCEAVPRQVRGAQGDCMGGRDGQTSQRTQHLPHRARDGQAHAQAGKAPWSGRNVQFVNIRRAQRSSFEQFGEPGDQLHCMATRRVKVNRAEKFVAPPQGNAAGAARGLDSQRYR